MTRTVVVFSIDYADGDSGTVYYATLGEARSAKRKWFSPDDEIQRLTLVDLPPKALAARLLNGEQFVAKREKVS